MFPCREGLSFRDSNLSHHFVDAPSPGEKDRVVARRIGAVAADSEGGIDGKPFLRRDPRLVEPAEARKCGRKIEMRGVEIPVDLDRMAQLRDGVFVLAKKDSCDTQIGPPKIGKSVAWAKSERIVDMGFRLFSAPEEALGNTDVPVSVSEIAVDRKRPLELGNSLRDPIAVNTDEFPNTRVLAPFRARSTTP